MSMVPCNIFINALVPVLWNVASDRWRCSTSSGQQSFVWPQHSQGLYENVESIQELYMYIYIYVDFCLYDIHENRYF